MKSTDILKPKSVKDINSSLSLGHHTFKTVPANQLFVFLKAGFIWAFVGLMIAYAFVAPVFICIFKYFFGFYEYHDEVECIMDSKLFEKMGGVVRKHGFLDKWG